jgi:transcriptional regulator with XRE-family HTH domain
MDGKKEIQAKFGSALKKALKQKKLSLRKLAIEADMEYAHVQRIATGKVNLELTTIIALSNGLKITPEELFSFY